MVKRNGERSGLIWTDDGDERCVTKESLFVIVEDIVNSDGGTAIDKLLELYHELVYDEG